MDLNLVEFHHIVDNLRHIYDHRRREHMERIDGPKVTGMFIPCAAEEEFDCRTFEAVSVAAAQLSAQSEIASPIMTRIGISLIIRRLPFETRRRDRWFRTVTVTGIRRGVCSRAARSRTSLSGRLNADAHSPYKVETEEDLQLANMLGVAGLN
ncbi:uncharacterized protein M421DRAFT_94425 [Didymella exigua CBS 183.55]|uniref:Uncharacterized protein n=1 Tax=Didymella exigua CBS 183.55 TaxID=1150837 RepID=A0A6A5RJP3_9PLEO|nr:uncharacterized protein M421DRAFT_94425 [Didymella exigua CBS 183.55]KAF1925797.1 hypothetical protein M421DRAFT_94425 [Didymella exigua CBS 183.55]